MSTVNVTLSCTGTGTATVKKTPTKVANAVGTISVSILKSPLKVLSSTAVSDLVLSLVRFGIDSFDVIQVGRKWIITNVGGWQVKASKRFVFLVRGRPSG